MTLTHITQIFGQEPFPFQLIPERINRFLMRADPIVLYYTLDPSLPPPERPTAYDVEVKVDDTSLKGRMNHVVMSMSPDSSKDLSKLDDEVRIDFLSQFWKPAHECSACRLPYTSNLCKTRS